jgi:hypothetical protein
LGLRVHFTLAAGRRGDRIWVVRLTFALLVLITLIVDDQTQPQKAVHANRVFFGPFTLVGSEQDLRDLGYVHGRNIGGYNAGKNSSSSGSDDRRCEMSPEEFAKFYPPLRDWIQAELIASAQATQTIVSRGFSRLPLYFTEKTFASTKVVLVDPLPMPPLSSMGLARFADFERGDFDGITYFNTIFLKPTQSNNETMHFHELVHVVQWRLLGPDRFLLSYANGLECFGYRQSPLEVMSYDAEAAFASSTAIFNVEKMVAEKLGL